MDGLFMSGEAVRDIRDATLADECLSVILFASATGQTVSRAAQAERRAEQRHGRTG